MNVLSAVTLAIVRRWQRNLLTFTAVALGIATLVTLLALSHSSARQTAHRLDAYDDTLIEAILPASMWRVPEHDLTRRLTQSGLIAEAGTFTPVPNKGDTWVTTRTGETTQPLSIIAATPAGLKAHGVRLVAGSGWPDEAILAADGNYAYVGLRLAKELRLGSLERPQTVQLNGQPVTVTGVITDIGNRSVTSPSIIVTVATATHLNTIGNDRALAIRSAPRHTATVTRFLADAISPATPDTVQLRVNLGPQQLRTKLLGDSYQLIAIVSIVIVVVSILTIAITMQMAVTERRKEIGILRAMGMRRWEVAHGFLLESSILGLTGAAVGFVAGVLATSSATHLMAWSFVLPGWSILVIPGGLLAGAISGLVPALMTGRIDPATLLRN